jgi:hypothetical protein
MRRVRLWRKRREKDKDKETKKKRNGKKTKRGRNSSSYLSPPTLMSLPRGPPGCALLPTPSDPGTPSGGLTKSDGIRTG